MQTASAKKGLRTPADVQLVGGPAHDQQRDRWCGNYRGAAVGPTDGLMYLVPHDATRAARFDPKSGTWEAFGDTFPGDQRKWSGAAVSSFDNCIYSVPYGFNAVHKMLKIDPIAGTAKEVGEDLRPFATETGKGESGCGECWGDVVAAADGCIYGIPEQCNSVLRYDPRTGKASCEMSGWTRDMTGYRSGILGPSGRFIFAIPFTAKQVLCIDTKMRTLQLIGECFDYWCNGKWVGGGIGGDGCLYCIPYEMKSVLRIDPVAMTTSLYGPNLHIANGNGLLWAGGCVGPDGCVYGTPYHSNHVLCIDPFAGTVSMVGKPVPEEVKKTLGGAVLGKDENVWFLPSKLPARMLRLKPEENAATKSGKSTLNKLLPNLNIAGVAFHLRYVVHYVCFVFHRHSDTANQGLDH